MADNTHGYVYDAENRLTCVLGTDGTCTSASAMLYLYDAQGPRVGKQQADTLEDYVYDPQGHIISVHDGSANLLRSELYSPDGRHVSTWEGNTWNTSQLFWNHADWLGTERVRTTSAGAIYETCADTPYGMNLTCTNPPPNPPSDTSPMHFTGKQRDYESNLDYFGARYFGGGNNLGRFMTPDWSAKPQGVPYAALDDPQTLNLYGYLRNNPLGGVDADGHQCDTLGPITACLHRSEFKSIRDAEDAHEAQHRRDWWFEDLSMPGWKREQRGMAAEIPILEKRLAELAAKEKSGGLTESEKREEKELTEELQTVKDMTQGPEADRNAKRYYRNNQNWLAKKFIPNPDKPPEPGVEPSKQPECIGCHNPVPKPKPEDFRQ